MEGLPGNLNRTNGARLQLKLNRPKESQRIVCSEVNFLNILACPILLDVQGVNLPDDDPAVQYWIPFVKRMENIPMNYQPVIITVLLTT